MEINDDAAVRGKIQVMTVLTNKPEVGSTDAAPLVEKLTEIYLTPTPKGGVKAKK